MTLGSTMFGTGLLLVVVLGCSFQLSDGKKVRTINVDKAFDRWGKNVNYYLDPAFTPAEATMINQAINRVAVSLSSCITFTPVAATAPVFKLKFTPLTGGPGSPPQTYCFATPGVNITARQTSLEQVVSLARGPTGCLDSYCSIQKYLAITLGKRNEHQRGDRDDYITVQPDANLGVPGAYTKYSDTQANWKLFTYDYCSITHNQPTDFAKSGAPAFTVKAGKLPGFIPKLCQLSTTDCKLISMLQGCNSALCANIDCASQTQTPATTTAVTTPGTTATTTPGVTTTLAPCLTNICGTAPDEAARLLDGRIMVFAGQCAQELNPSNNQKMGAAVQISALFPGVVGPLAAVWQTSPTLLHVLTQANQQYACTTTGCTVEPSTKSQSTVTSVFESVGNTASPTWPPTVFTIDSTETTWGEDPNPSSSNPVPNVQGNFPVGPLTSWLAAYRTNTADPSNTNTPATEVINVIGKDVSTIVLQQMVYTEIFPGLNTFFYIAPAVPVSALWCP